MSKRRNQPKNLDPRNYEGREQSFSKHIFLEKYLESVAFHILSRETGFVYVDGFSGPWLTESQNIDDTSFAIAIRKLQYIQEALATKDRHISIRCLFIEDNKERFKSLSEYTSQVSGISASARHGSFSESISSISEFIGNDFSLIFVDPKGWKDYPLEYIAPLLNRRGEIIINFMFDHLNRFLFADQDTLKKTKNALFGGSDWREEIRQHQNSGLGRELSVLETYKARLKDTGNYKYCTSTRIRYPTEDRTYYHLVYATRHPKGIIEFRKAEKNSSELQEKARLNAIQAKREQEFRTRDLFGETEKVQSRSFDDLRQQNLRLANDRLRKIVHTENEIDGLHLKAEIQQIPLVWKQDIDQMILELRTAGYIEVIPWKPRKRTLYNNDVVRRL